jgi:hypothetical protein
MKLFILLLFITISSQTFSQLTKNTWLVGGNAKFYSYNSEYSSPTYNSTAKYTQIDLSAPLGYFIADKVALGIKPTFSSNKGEVTSAGGGKTNVQRYLVGPFGRYYWLNKDQQYNIVTDASYQFGFFGGGLLNGSLSTFSASAGPVIYFNTTVGVEFLLGYSYSKEDVKDGSNEVRKGFQIGIGLQIHLEK